MSESREGVRQLQWALSFKCRRQQSWNLRASTALIPLAIFLRGEYISDSATEAMKETKIIAESVDPAGETR